MQRKRPSTHNASEQSTRIDMARQRRETRPARRSSPRPSLGRASGSRASASRSWMTNAAVTQSPVLVRRGRAAQAEDTAIGKNASSRKPSHNRARRRYDIALNVPGAEIRLPSLPALAFSWRIASAALVLMMGVALYFLLYSTVFQVSVVDVVGMQRVTLDDLNPVLALTGEAIVRVDPLAVEQRLLAAFPEFASAQVRIGLPAQVNVFVTERQPVIDWVVKGQEQWVDDQGVAFPPRGQVDGLLKVQADASPLPTLVDPQAAPASNAAVGKSASASQAAAISQISAHLLPVDLVSTILSMRSYLPDGSVLLYSAGHGLGWNDVGGWVVYFGSQLKDIDQKLLVYQAVADRLNKDGVKPSMISVENLHAPYYRVEK